VLSGLADLHEVPQTGENDGIQLIDLDGCESAAASGDVQRWSEALAQLERAAHVGKLVLHT